MNDPSKSPHRESSACCPNEKKPSFTAGLPGQALRFSGWFVGFAGLFSMSSACPFCGKACCPVGGASAGIIGLVFGSLAQWGGAFVKMLSAFIKNRF